MSQIGPSPLSTLGDDLLTSIFAWLPADPLIASVSRVCRRWRNTIRKQPFWHLFCRVRKFAPLALCLRPEHNWRAFATDRVTRLFLSSVSVWSVKLRARASENAIFHTPISGASSLQANDSSLLLREKGVVYSRLLLHSSASWHGPWDVLWEWAGFDPYQESVVLLDKQGSAYWKFTAHDRANLGRLHLIEVNEYGSGKAWPCPGWEEGVRSLSPRSLAWAGCHSVALYGLAESTGFCPRGFCSLFDVAGQKWTVFRFWDQAILGVTGGEGNAVVATPSQIECWTPALDKLLWVQPAACRACLVLQCGDRIVAASDDRSRPLRILAQKDGRDLFAGDERLPDAPVVSMHPLGSSSVVLGYENSAVVLFSVALLIPLRQWRLSWEIEDDCLTALVPIQGAILITGKHEEAMELSASA